MSLWSGMCFGPWWKMLARHRFDVAPSRIPMAAAITLFSALNSCSAVLQHALYGRRIAATQLKPEPLFILGHWRSGTTLLHQLLCIDPRHVGPTFLECFAPEHCLILRRLAPALKFLLAPRRPMDAMSIGWHDPQEDEFAAVVMGYPSPNETFAFPNHRHPDWRYTDLDDLDRHELECREKAWLRFLRTVICRRPGRLVLKDPLHTCRIPRLTALFPQAKYVYVMRDPRRVIASTIHLRRSMYRTYGLQRPDLGDLEDEVFRDFAHLHERFEQHRSRIDPQALFELRFERLIANPAESIRQLYEHLSLGGFAQIEQAVRQYCDKNRDYQPNRYTLSPRLTRRIEVELAPYVQRYGYA